MRALAADNPIMDLLDVDDRRFVVTRADDTDLPDIVGLLADDPLGSAREESDLEIYRQAFQRVRADEGQLIVVVREEDTHEIVGTMQLSLIPGLARAGVTRLQIEAVRIAEGVRGTGFGSAMLDWAHDYGRRHGAGLAQLTSDRLRDDAHRFYESLGYSATHLGFKRRL